MESPPSNNLVSGQLVGGGRYELRRLLGMGGMGAVWLAYDSRLKEEVALKFLPTHIAGDAVALDDLRSETLKNRRLAHPNLVRIHDLSESPDEMPFLSMEYVQGSNLNELRLVQPGKVFTWEFLQPLVKQLCNALQYAHGEGLVHRDLKPGNLMLDARNRLKLADFGTASVIHDSARRTTVGTHVIGTPGYMSPQQLTGERPSVADDIYSLGATLYELLTSRPPFYSGDITHQTLHTPATPIEQRLWELTVDNPVPPNVSATILSCLDKAPERRPPDVKTLAAWLEMESAPAGIPLSAEESQPSVISQARRPSIALIATGLVLLTLLVGGIFWLKRSKPASITTVSSKTTETSSPITADTGEEWHTIFNGSTLSDWEGDHDFWSVQDGTIEAQAPKGWKGKHKYYLIWRGGSVTDFELKFQFKLLHEANSGVFYRAKDNRAGDVTGYQFEIFAKKTGNLLDVGDDIPRRDLAFRGQQTRVHLQQGSEQVDIIGSLGDPNNLAGVIRDGEWNEGVIRAQGTKLTHTINGHTMLEASDENEQKHRLSGLLALEFFVDNDQRAVQFRDLKLRQLQ